MSLQTGEKARYIVFGVLVLIIIGMFFYSSKTAKQNPATAGKQDSSSGFSVDDSKRAYKTISYQEAIKKLTQADGDQMYYVGCRYCGYCKQLEGAMEQFLAKHQDKNKDRDLIYNIEASYVCVPKNSDKDYDDYIKIFDLFVKFGLVEDNPQKSFGTPQFIYVKNGKLVDDLNNYGRSEASLKAMFEKHHYRGF